jgi:hypothetical protein
LADCMEATVEWVKECKDAIEEELVESGGAIM